MYKQVILVRQDLKLPKGKMAAQVAHASVACVLDTKESMLDDWLDEGMKKLVLKVADRRELFKFKKLAEEAGLVVHVVSDAGHTVVSPGTVTCLGIGPDREEKIDAVTGELKLIS